MQFDFENPHTAYVVAAYAVAAMGYVTLILHTILKWRALRKMERRS